MWYDSSVFYQIYPLGFCGAPQANDGHIVPRILKIRNWIGHLEKLNVNAVYFSPVFESDRHGYDTRDYKTVDCRLGSNADFAGVCRYLHDHGMRVVFDGVFNHVGRGFWAFEDVRRQRENSRYRDWFMIDFNGNSPYDDGFAYEGWEGHYELVKLNLKNPEVVDYLFSCIRGWVEEFDIDGLRLDVAYCLDTDFLRRLRQFCDGFKSDFVLIGEVLFGDYNRIVNGGMCHSCTNYECYKGIHSSFNELNLFEINYSLNRQFGPESWALYRGMHLLSFADNHDVSRIASVLKDKRHLPLVYGLLFGMPGVPCVYYGSEWGAEGSKQDGDSALRPCFEAPCENELFALVSRLAAIRRQSKALCFGGYRMRALTNRQLIFERAFDGERVIVVINADAQPYHADIREEGAAIDLLSGEKLDLGGGCDLSPYGLVYWRIGG